MFDIYPNQNKGLDNAKSKRQQSPLQSYETEVKQQNQNNGYECSQNFYDSLVRADFVQRVYTLLAIELLITIVMIFIGLYTGIQRWLINYWEFDGTNLTFNAMGTSYVYSKYSNTSPPNLGGVFYVACFASITLHSILFCKGNCARKGAISFIIVFLYIIFFGLMFTPICIIVAYNCGTAIVWQAWGTIFTTFFGLTIYVFNTKKDITFLVGAIFILSPNFLALIFLLCIWPSYGLNICLCCYFTVMYEFLLVWETQLMMGKGESCTKRLLKLSLSIDDYVFGSLILYASFNQLIIRVIEICFLLLMGCAIIFGHDHK